MGQDEHGVAFVGQRGRHPGQDQGRTDSSALCSKEWTRSSCGYAFGKQSADTCQDKGKKTLVLERNH